MTPLVAIPHTATPSSQPQPQPQPQPSRAPQALASGFPDFDDLALVAPARVTLLDLGCAEGSTLVGGLVAGAVAAGREAMIVDGGNWTDVYRLGERARPAGVTRADLLDNVRVARGFTVYQYQSLVEDALPRALADANGAVGLVVAASFPELYLDVDVAPAEARVLATRALRALKAVAERHAVPVVVTNATISPRMDHPLRRVLDAGADEVAGLHAAPGGGLLVRVPRRGVVVLAPHAGARQRRLPEFDADAVPVADTGPTGEFVSHLPDVHLARLVSKMRRVPSRAGEQRWLRQERNPTPIVKAAPRVAREA